MYSLSRWEAFVHVSKRWPILTSTSFSQTLGPTYLSQLLESITPNKPELAVNSLAPFFLVTHNHGGGPSSPADGNIPSHLANLNSLGHPMMDSMVSKLEAMTKQEVYVV